MGKGFRWKSCGADMLVSDFSSSGEREVGSDNMMSFRTGPKGPVRNLLLHDPAGYYSGGFSAGLVIPGSSFSR